MKLFWLVWQGLFFHKGPPSIYQFCQSNNLQLVGGHYRKGDAAENRSKFLQQEKSPRSPEEKSPNSGLSKIPKFERAFPRNVAPLGKQEAVRRHAETVAECRKLGFGDVGRLS
jgi:hypothetical protein